MSKFREEIFQIVKGMDSISLSEIQVLSLMDRLDVKFILHESQFQQVMERASNQYRVLEINGARAGRYWTTYFDTPDFELYRTHHNGNRVRYKVRWRWYLDSEVVFLEIKEKTNKERTMKVRIPIPEPVTDLSTLDHDWMPAGFTLDLSTLRPIVWNRFRRLMLADTERRERITVDIGIHFGADGRVYELPGLVVVEVKQRKFSLSSPIARELHRLHVNPCHISKYCIAMATLYPELRQNQFKPILRRLEQISGIRGVREYRY